MATTPKKISDILFSIGRQPLEICPGQFSNSFAPVASAHSPKRGTKKSRNSNPPKFSRLAVDLVKIFNGKISAIWAKDGSFVYCEVVDDTLLYNARNHELHGSNSTYIDIAMFLWALHDSSPEFQYTRESAASMVATMDAAARTVQATDLGFLCDCFYYDLVGELAAFDGSVMYDEFTDNDLEAVKQAIRTNSITIVETPFNDFLSTNFRNITYAPASNAGVAASKTSTADFFTQAKDGSFLLPFDWGEEQEQRIRPLNSLDNYIPNASYQKIAQVAYKRLSRVIDRQNLGKTGLDAIKDDYVNIIIGGRPGTGKTTTADALSATLGLPIYTAKVTRNTEEDTFEGMTKADGDGKFAVHDTAFLKAFETGGIVVLEEFNLADPGVLQGAIGQAVEYPFILNKDGYMEIRRHPMCVIIATMNTGTQGAREPNQALTSRFPITLTMNDPTEQEFLSILEKHGHKKTLCKKVYKAYTSILKYLKNTANDEEMALCVTMRHCLAALEMLDDGIVDTVREAIYDTMIGSIGLRDADMAEDVYSHAILPLGGLD